jgi:hypothetical protein
MGNVLVSAQEFTERRLAFNSRWRDGGQGPTIEQCVKQGEILRRTQTEFPDDWDLMRDIAYATNLFAHVHSDNIEWSRIPTPDQLYGIYQEYLSHALRCNYVGEGLRGLSFFVCESIPNALDFYSVVEVEVAIRSELELSVDPLRDMYEREEYW